MASSRFIRGTRIQWGSLGLAVIGTIVFAWFDGVARWLQSLAWVPRQALAITRQLTVAWIDLVLGFPGLAARRGWIGALEFIGSAGPAGFLVALGIVLLTIYPLRWALVRIADEVIGDG